MSKEEDDFNKLMGFSSRSEPKKSEEKGFGSESPSQKTEDPEELLSKYSVEIEGIIDSIVDLESFLKQALGSSFSKIRGAWDQFKSKEITKKGLVQSGIYVFGKSFVLPFINHKKMQKEKGSPSTVPFQDKKEVQEVPSYHPNTLIHKSVPEPKFAPEPKFTLEPKYIPEPKVSQEPKIKIPSVLLASAGIRPKAAPTPPPVSTHTSYQSETPLFKTFSVSKVDTEVDEPKIIVPEKIESVAPKKETMSYIDAIKKVGTELEKVPLTPIQFAKLDEDEIKSVNVSASLPGTQAHDDFENVRQLLYTKQYDAATQRLKEIKAAGERRKNEFAIGKSEEMLTQISVYKMIPDLLESAENTKTNLERSKEVYQKALGFVALLGDPHYSAIINEKISEINEKISFSKMKKDAESQEVVKMKKLIKENIRRLGKTESMVTIADIRKYCAAKSEEIVTEILVEMIQNTEIYAKFFPESKKVMFDKDANREKLLFRNI